MAEGKEERKSFPLRLPASLKAALERCAARNFRSSNSMIESILREHLSRNGYLKGDGDGDGDDGK